MWEAIADRLKRATQPDNQHKQQSMELKMKLARRWFDEIEQKSSILAA